jgi:hypothetical protein
MNRGERRRAMKVGTLIFTKSFIAYAANGELVGHFWFEVPEGMTTEQAFETQEHHGPFRSEAEAEKNKRLVLLGPDCKVTEGGMWDPAWDKLQ